MKVEPIVMQPFDADSAASDFVEHGGRVSVARAKFPTAPLPWLDLSTGISPWPYPIPPLAVESWARLPDPADLLRLTDAARAHYQVPPPARVLAVAGTDLAIAVLPRLALSARKVGIVAPTYGAHEKAWAASGHDVTLAASLDAIAASDIGIVVNPNNPTGRVWSADEIAACAARLAKRGGLLIVDEAFADIAPGSSILSSQADLSNVIVLRSFGKFYGLAGVRLGFVITAHSIAERLADTFSEWPVSGPAIEIGRTALCDSDWADQSVAKLNVAAAKLDCVLQASGLTVLGGTGLFRLATHVDGWQIFGRLARRGILTRPIASSHSIRFGIPACGVDFERLTSALASPRDQPLLR